MINGELRHSASLKKSLQATGETDTTNYNTSKQKLLWE